MAAAHELSLRVLAARGLPRLDVDQALVFRAALAGSARESGLSLRRGEHEAGWPGDDGELVWAVSHADVQHLRALSPTLKVSVDRRAIVPSLGGGAPAAVVALGYVLIDLRGLGGAPAPGVPVSLEAQAVWLPLLGVDAAARAPGAEVQVVVRLLAARRSMEMVDSLPPLPPLPTLANPPALAGSAGWGSAARSSQQDEPLARRRAPATSPSPSRAGGGGEGLPLPPPPIITTAPPPQQQQQRQQHVSLSELLARQPRAPHTRQ